MQRDELLRKVAHDLMNCLAPIRNALALLERPDSDAETAAYARGLIDKQLGAMEEFCDALSRAAPHMTGASVWPVATPARSILVVDDNRAWVDSLALALRQAGHDVHIAYDGRRAVELAEDLKPEVVILDIEMPEVSGYEAARQLRRRSSTRRPTLIALTVWSDDTDRALAREAGFDHHLAKPMAFEELLRIVAAA